MLGRFGLMIYFRVVLYCSCVINRSPWSIVSLLNIETLTIFRWTCLNYLCFNKSPCSIWRTEFFVKNSPLISWERYVFLPSYMLSSRPDLSRIRFGVGWADWKNLVCRTTSPSGCREASPSGCRSTFEPNSLVHSWRSEIFGGGRGDMHTFSYKSSPIFFQVALIDPRLLRRDLADLQKQLCEKIVSIVSWSAAKWIDSFPCPLLLS